ncbi:MAG: hypothetical protein AAGC60_03005 [Acidobacteriota bacterium]
MIHRMPFLSLAALAAFVLAAPMAAQDPSSLRAGEEQSPFGLSDIENFPEADLPALTRADLYACEQLDEATAQQPGDASTAEFAQALSGTWVREVTWYGVSMPTESVLFFDLRPSGGVAMMYDLVTLGLGPMSRELDAIRNSLALRARTPELTYLICDKGIRDSFFKISDEHIFDGLPVETMSDLSLDDVWQQLIEQKYFDRHQFPLPAEMRDEPGSEVLTPSVVGAFWNITLQPVTIDSKRGVRMSLEGEYRGSHWPAGEVLSGLEFGDFLRDGDAFVAAVGHSANDRSGRDNYVNKVDPNYPIAMDRVVLDTASSKFEAPSEVESSGNQETGR